MSKGRRLAAPRAITETASRSMKEVTSKPSMIEIQSGGERSKAAENEERKKTDFIDSTIRLPQLAAGAGIGVARYSTRFTR